MIKTCTGAVGACSTAAATASAAKLGYRRREERKCLERVRAAAAAPCRLAAATSGRLAATTSGRQVATLVQRGLLAEAPTVLRAPLRLAEGGCCVASGAARSTLGDVVLGPSQKRVRETRRHREIPFDQGPLV